MSKFYVDDSGAYLGAFHMPSVKGKEPRHPKVPAGAVEVPRAPGDARQIWAGGVWGDPPPEPTPPRDIFLAQVQAATNLGELKAAILSGYL